MDDEDANTVSADGVTVEKHVDTDQFKTPAVVLEITSVADRTVTVTVTEPIPEEFAIGDIGFHPEFGGEYWSISGREITFEREVDPGEEYTTVYGIRDIDEEEITTFLGTGTSVETDYDADTGGGADTEADHDADGDTDPVEELLEKGDDDAVRDVIAGDRDSLPEMEGEADTPDEDQPGAATEEVPGIEEGTEPPQEKAGDSSEEESEDDKAGVVGSESSEYRTLPGSVAEALATEIRDGTIAAENERVLREAFAEPEEASGSVDARIEHLQTQVADLSAYTDELERFLDEHGGGDSALAAVEEELSEVTETVEALEDGVHALEESTDELGSDVDDIEPEVADVEADVDALDDRVEETEARLDDAETGIDDLLYLEEDLMELEDRTEELPELKEAIEELREERVADLDSRLEGLEGAIDTLKSEMEDMKAFRDRLSSAFGPGGEQDVE
jgi:outer membrane murein-binding lipoprotein Lpp